MKKEFNSFIYSWPIFLTAFLMSVIGCNVNRTVTGKITEQTGYIVTIDSARKFKVFDTTGLFVGKVLTFTPTVNRSKINSRRKN